MASNTNPNYEQHIGKQIGKIQITGVDETGTRALLTYVCACGNTGKVRTSVARYPDRYPNRDCGECVAHLAGSTAKGKALYMVWQSMLARCYPKEGCEDQFPRYAGRGIKVCKSWYHDKMKFVNWALTNGFDLGLQLDRIDNDIGYRPSNCRFVTPKENSRNRANTIKVIFRGKEKTLAEVAEKHAVVSAGLVYERYVNMGWDLEHALRTPARKGNYGHEKRHSHM